jgi:CRISPR-associated protein Csb2
MDPRALLIEVGLFDGRYHGNNDWPPSPFRLFQALVAGAYGGRWTCEPAAQKDDAFKWLERLAAPHVAAPRAYNAASVSLYVPNNDLDAKEGDPLLIEKIRVKKPVAPRLLDGEPVILYAWPFETGEGHAVIITRLAERMHTLGLGLDAAFARAETATWSMAEARLAAHGGHIARPTRPGTTGLTCPIAGSLESLKARHRYAANRFRREGKWILYSNAPKPRFRQIAYDTPPVRLLFDLVGARPSWRLDRIVELTEHVRDAVAKRLKERLPDKAEKVHTAIIGRRDADEADKAARVRITPLPSIGHRHADRAIRRILIEIPPTCPLRGDDVEWAFSSLLIASDQGEILCELVTAAERGMLAHYGIEDAEPASLWRSVTPGALPQQLARRRIDPTRRREEAKAGVERTEEEGKAASAVVHALRHAGVEARPLAVHVQREPFDSKGARAEAFAPGTRFAKERLWHIEVAFAEAIPGPLLLGDGRYLGLGVMAPVERAGRDAFIFSLPPLRVSVTHRTDLTGAVRRALMALSRDARGDVPRLFSGHEVDGSAARSGRHEHVFIAAADIDDDGYIDVLMIAAPWACDRSLPARRRDRQLFDDVVSSVERVRTGRLGVIELNGLRSPSAASRLLGPARHWESHTPYHPTRHAGRRQDLDGAAVIDTIAECTRRGLPMPRVELLEVTAGPYRGAIAARTRLEFSVAVEGPILLGRDSHGGGGLFLSGARLPPQE